MASFFVVLCGVTLLVATSSAAPKHTKLSIKIPDECVGKGFCSIRPEGYDEIEEKINRLLPPYLIDFSDRQGDTSTPPEEKDEDNCPSKVWPESVYIYDHPSEKTKVDIIVQTKLFPQKFNKVVCKHNLEGDKRHKEKGAQCFKNLGLDHGFNLNFSCQESSAMRSLLVYDPDVDIIKMKNYTIPVCCSCKITNV